MRRMLSAIIVALSSSLALAGPAMAASACFDPQAQAEVAMRDCGELLRAPENQRRRAEIHARIGYLFVGAYEYGNALAAYREASSIEPGNPFYAVAVVDAAASAGQFADALAAGKLAVDRFPNFAPAHAARGRAHLGQREFDAAISDFTTSLEISGPRGQGAVNVLHDRAKAYVGQGRNALGLADLNAALAVAPDHFGVLWTRADILRSIGDNAAAVSAYSTLIAKVDGPALRSGRAQSLLALGRADEAFRDFEVGLTIDPSSVVALSARGWAYFQIGKYAEAANDAERALALQPNEPNPMFTACAARTMSGSEPAKAVDLCGRLVALSNDAETRGFRGVAYLRLGRIREADADFAQSAAALPSSGLAFMGRSITLARLGRATEAEAARQTAVRLDPQIIGKFRSLNLAF